MSTTTVKATGLTCNHCAMSVSEGQRSSRRDRRDRGRRQGRRFHRDREHEGTLSTQAVADAIVGGWLHPCRLAR